MDTTEVHYLTYDPDEIWTEMLKAYVEAGGDILYPGDEKEMLLRSVLADIVQVFAAVDNALRMQTLRYAVGEYLDILGEQRSCERIGAKAAKATVTITANATGRESVVSAGTAMTADGSVFYLLDDDLELTGSAQTQTVSVTAEQTGTTGNALLAGAELSLASTNPAVSAIVAATDAGGGQDKEDDDTYRERIRAYMLTSVTAGPKRQYEAIAEAVSSVIVDARAMAAGAGTVCVYLALSDDAGSEALIAEVEAALNDDNVRPLTDLVTVQLADEAAYTLNVRYIYDGSADIQAAAEQAAADYQVWQENTIGQAFNPDRLMAALYQAGVTRVIWDEGSEFEGGSVEYTQIADYRRCKGTITLTAVVE